VREIAIEKILVRSGRRRRSPDSSTGMTKTQVASDAWFNRRLNVVGRELEGDTDSILVLDEDESDSQSVSTEEPESDDDDDGGVSLILAQVSRLGF